jgi:curved DNA-binding protein
MEYKDYYKILGVKKNASDKEIKAAYRALARKHHPDVNAGSAGAEARFKEVGEAYQVLSDPEKRRRYDELGSNWKAYERGGWPGGAGGARVRVNMNDFGGGDMGGFSDFFRTFFGGGFGGGASGFPGFGGEPPGGGRAPNADVEHPVELSLEEVLKGTTRTLRVGGSSRQVEVKIPPGVAEGSRIRVAGEGGGSGAQRGDLFLRVKLRRHPDFEVRGADLQTELRVPLTTSVLGGDASVATLTGRAEIKIPPGSPPGRVFRLRGQGLPRRGDGSGRGDLLATLAVDLPRGVAGREKELFEELRRLGH